MNYVNINGVIYVPSLDAGRYCLRCGAGVHGPADRNPHLCKDVAAGLRDAQDQDFRDYARSLVVYGGQG